MSENDTRGSHVFGEPFLFNTTHWSVVLTAQRGASPAAQAAMTELCGTYWYPLYAFVRRQGHPPPDAQDLTQAFFEHLLQKDFLSNVSPHKGRFRSFLLACLKHFLADEWDKVRAERSHAAKPVIALDALDAEARYRLEPADRQDPERLYARRWALTLIDRVLGRLEKEFSGHGNAVSFERVQTYLLDDEGPTYAELAAQLGTTEAAIKMTLYRMRRRYRELFREEIAQTVANPAEVDEEIQYLLDCLSG
jgi:DNA-directed RNA polymerase specialized sigma24 family protein